MSNTTDGRVIINIESNANSTAKEFENLDKQTGKYGETLKELKARGFSETKKTINLLKKEMNDMALSGLQNTKMFKDFAREVRLAQNSLNNAKNIVNQSTSVQNKLRQTIKGLNTDTNNSVVSTKLFGLSLKNLSSFTGAAVAGLAAFKLKDLTVEVIKTAGAFETLTTDFKILTGNNAVGETLTRELVKLANVTPMTTEGLARNAQTLLSFGEATKNILPDLQLLGDITGGNRARMDAMTLAFAQVGSTGKLMGQDLHQMINAGFNPLQAISEKTGKSIGTLQKEMQEGKIAFSVVKQAMVEATAEGGRFYGRMEEQSKTLDGRLSTLTDTWTLLGNTIGQEFLPAAKNVIISLTAIGNAAQWVIEKLSPLGLNTQQLNNQAEKVKRLRNEVKYLETSLNNTQNSYQKWNLQSQLDKKNKDLAFNLKQLQTLNINNLKLTEGQRKAREELTKALDFGGNGFKDSTGSDKHKKEKRQSTISEQLQKDYNDGLRYLQDLAAQGVKSGEVWDKQVSKVKGLGEAIKSMKNATDESLLEPLQLFNKHIQDAQDRVNNLAASKIVNLAELRSAKVELTDLKNKMQEMQIAAETSPFRAMQAQKSHLEAQFLDLSIVGQANTPQAIALKNSIKEYENSIKRAQTSLASYMGVSWENISSSISTNLSQAITTPLQEGENALERFGNVALNTFQMVAQSYISSFINAKMMGVQQNGGMFQTLFGGGGGFVTGGAAQITELKTEMDKLKGSFAPVGAAIAQIGGTQSAAIASLKASIPALSSSAASYRAAAVAAQKLASSITQAAIAQAAFSAAKVPVAGAALAPLAAMATGASIGAANMLASAGMLASRITAFKDGGVIDRATYFPMKGNRMGLMGEAGSEAIMPLRRTSDGRLGVEAANVSQPNINIYNQAGAEIETVQRPDGDYEIFIRKVNSALNNERTNAGFTRAMQRNSSKGIQAC